MQMQEAAEKEWHQFREERTAGIAEIDNLRQRVAEEEARRKSEREIDKDEMDAERPPASADTGDEEDKPDAGSTEPTGPSAAADMEVDSGAQREEHKETSEHERKEEPAPMQPDDEDAVEY